MRLSPSRVEQTLNQFEARVLPDNHPSMPKIKEVWGDHTYFLAVNGLNIVEPLDRRVMLLYLEDLDAASIGEVTGLSSGNAHRAAEPP